MIKKRLTLILILIFGVIHNRAYAQVSPSIRASQFNLQGTLAIEGYDPVAYYVEKKAVKGKQNLTVNDEGVLYRFSTQRNLDLFKKSPSSYEPQYGGWCAYAMGNFGDKVEVDPETFKIIDGKLFLFYNSYFNNTLKTWNKNEQTLKAKADANWKKIIFKNTTK